MNTTNHFNKAVMSIILLIFLVIVFGWMIRYFYKISLQKVSISKLQSIHAQLIQASRFSSMVHDEDMGSFKTDMPINLFAEKYFTPYLDIHTYCKGAQDNCWNTPQYRDLGGTPYYNKSLYSIVLTDGSVIGFNKDKNNLVTLIIDTNGKVKPNKLGQDVFLFSVYNIDPPPKICEKSKYENVATFSGIHFGGLDNCGIPYDTYSYEELASKDFTDGCNKKSPASPIGFGAGSSCAALLKLNAWTVDKNYPW